MHAAQPIGAAGKPRHRVGEFVEEKSESEGDHEQRQVADTHDREAHHITGRRSDQAGNDEAGQRLAPAVGADDGGRIGANAEEHRVTERHAAGIAKHQIQREREERGDGDLAGERQVIREKKKGSSVASQNAISGTRPARLARSASQGCGAK